MHFWHNTGTFAIIFGFNPEKHDCWLKAWTYINVSVHIAKYVFKRFFFLTFYTPLNGVRVS